MSQVGFEANQEQAKDSIDGLVLLFSLIPAGFGALAIITSFFYPLGDNRVAEIEAELKERRNDAEVAAEA